MTEKNEKKPNKVAEAVKEGMSVAMGGKGQFGYHSTPGYVEDDSEDHLEAVAQKHGDRLIRQEDGTHIVEEEAPDTAPSEVRMYPAGDDGEGDGAESADAASDEARGRE